MSKLFSKFVSCCFFDSLKKYISSSVLFVDHMKYDKVCTLYFPSYSIKIAVS